MIFSFDTEKLNYTQFVRIVHFVFMNNLELDKQRISLLKNEILMRTSIRLRSMTSVEKEDKFLADCLDALMKLEDN